MKGKFWKYLMPAIFGVVIVGLSIFAIVVDTQKENYKRRLVGYYEKSFQDLVTDMGSLQTKLGKLKAASSDSMTNLILMDVWRQTGDTENSISNMPIGASQSMPFTQYINRLGDYCRYLSQKVSKGEKISDADMQQLDLLQKTSADISSKFNEVWNTGYIPALEMNEAAYDAQTASGNKQDNTQNLDFSNQQYPQLQYDGPFSESTENKQPLGLTGNDITREDAQNMALKFLGQEYVKQINFSGELNGDVPCYGFDGISEDGNFTIYMTKKGGSVLYFMTNTGSEVNAVPTDERYAQLTDIATSYLKGKGYMDTKPSYAQFYNGKALINLAPIEKDIVLYPDLIKVWVDIEKNKVLGLDTRNYLMSHKPRDLGDGIIKKDDALKKLNPRLKVNNTRLALIPTERQREIVCWEFTCSVDGSDYIIYINAQNGNEENILQIQHTNEGTLVM